MLPSDGPGAFQKPPSPHYHPFVVFVSLAVLGLHCCSQAFSSCGKWRLLSSDGAWASHCGGFSSFGAQTLRLVGIICGHRFSCSVAYGIFLDQG